MLPLIPPGTEVLAGFEMGGIAIATMLSHFSCLPAAFVRKSARSYDIAPTVCRLLNLPTADFEGRVLSEALLTQ